MIVIWLIGAFRWAEHVDWRGWSQWRTIRLFLGDPPRSRRVRSGRAATLTVASVSAYHNFRRRLGGCRSEGLSHASAAVLWTSANYTGSDDGLEETSGTMIEKPKLIGFLPAAQADRGAVLHSARAGTRGGHAQVQGQAQAIGPKHPGGA